MRPCIDIVFPVNNRSDQLERSVELLCKNTTNFRLHVIEEPEINVAEARQKAMQEIGGRYICFLDYDSETIRQGWLDALFSALDPSTKTGVAIGCETWGDEKESELVSLEPRPVEWGPSACMLIDKDCVPATVEWDKNIGLRNGWLGGDFEEVDYCLQLGSHGVRLVSVPSAVFHHTGGRTTMDAFMKTDRVKTVHIMRTMIEYKYRHDPDNKDFFKGIRYVAADPNNDTMLGVGQSLRECYHDVIMRNGMQKKFIFVQYGLT